MKRDIRLVHDFVEYLPQEFQDGTIYISIPYATAAHKCVCGCGNHVITPITPTDWQLTYDGETISLYPSIGNWNFPCQSHYWIRHNTIEWAPRWTPQQIKGGRAHDQRRKERHFERVEDKKVRTKPAQPGRGIWHSLKNWLS